MEEKKINQILMRMGGSTYNVSHLTKNGAFTISELQELVDRGYLIFVDNMNKVQKTKKAKEIW